MNKIKKEMDYLQLSMCSSICSHDYQQQRSVTSTSIEPTIDNTDDKRDNHRQQQRTNSSRQPQYSRQDSSSSTNNSNERSYTHGRFLFKIIQIKSLLSFFFRISIATTIKIWIKSKGKYSFPVDSTHVKLNRF